MNKKCIKNGWMNVGWEGNLKEIERRDRKTFVTTSLNVIKAAREHFLF